MPFHCPFDHLYDLEKWMHSDAPIREYSFLNNSRVHPRDRNDLVTLAVTGAPTSQPSQIAIHTHAAAAAHTDDQDATQTSAPHLPTRTLMMTPGDSYASAAKSLQAKGWADAFVVQVDARSLELLCEDLGSRRANREYNEMVHRVLGVAEQIRYCDRHANPFFDAPLIGGYDAMRNPINCTWGFHMPPAMPERNSIECPRNVGRLLADRRPEILRQWTVQNNVGMFSRYNGRQTWSTHDRVVDYYRAYI